MSGEGEEEPLRWAGGNKRALVGPLGLVFMKFIVGVNEQLFTNFDDIFVPSTTYGQT